LAADLLDRRDGGVYRGISGVSCVAPAGDAWLLGASTVVGAHSELRLTNTDDVPALIDVNLFGTKGPVTAPGSLGIAVAARSTKVVALERLAPEERLLLAHVQSRSGRVASALRVQVQTAATPQGVDWVPQAAAPSRVSVVPGVISGSGPRRLVLANPGDNDASAEVHVVLGTREFVPRGLSAVSVPAGQVVAVDLATALNSKAGGVYVKSDRPVVAGVSMSTGPRVNGFAELAWTAAAPGLTDPATVVVNYVRGRSTLLLFTAPETPADLRVTTLPGVGPSSPRSIDVHVPAGRTVQVNLDRYAKANVVVGVSVTVTAGSGAVYGAREEIEQGSRSPLYTVLPLHSAPQVRLVLPAVADLHAGLPG
jgi:hypothetical protein